MRSNKVNIIGLLATLLVLGGTYTLLAVPTAHAMSITECLGSSGSGNTWGLRTAQCFDRNGSVIGESVIGGALNRVGNAALGYIGSGVSAVASSVLAPALSWLLYWLASICVILLGVAASFFDILVRVSLNSTAYALGFLTTSWSLVLNLANMFFIFILIYTAFVIMLKAETTRTMQTLAWVIAIALVVNFSFFFTRVVIDAGNILAVQFYNATISLDVIAKSPQLAGGPDLTAGIMNAIGFTRLLGTDSFAAVQKIVGENSNGANYAVQAVVYLSTIIVCLMLIFAFISVGVKFLIRIVGLWFVLISSPIAFVTKTLPQSQHLFEMWLRTLVSFAFYPAIFLFMFYILTQFTTQLGNDLLFTFSTTGSTDSTIQLMGIIATVILKLGLVIAVLYIGLKVADWIMDQAGGMAGTMMNKASGLAFGTAGLALRGSAATTGWAGRKTAGRIATQLSKSPTIAAGALQTGLRGMLWRGAEKTTKKFASGTYDVRNAPGAGLVKKVFEKTTGVSLNVGKAAAKGFAEQSKELREKNEKERKERSAIVKDAATKETIKRVVAQSKTGTPHDPKDVDRLKNVSKREIENLKMADLENIAHILTAPQLKTVTDGDKFTDEEKEKLRIVWNEKSSDAPLIKAQKIVTNELRDLVRTMGTVGITLSTVAANTAVGRTMDGGAVGAMKTEVANEIAKVTSAIRKAPTGTDTTDEQKQLATLNNGLEALKKLDEERKKVPANVGAHIDEGKFLVT